MVLGVLVHLSRVGGLVVSKEYPHMHDNSRLLPDLILWKIGMLVDVVITHPGGTDAIDVTDPDRRVITVPDR